MRDDDKTSIQCLEELRSLPERIAHQEAELSKDLIEADGGRLTVESQENQGSTFTLLFPRQEAQE